MTSEARREVVDNKAKEEAERKANDEADRKTKEEAERNAKEEADGPKIGKSKQKHCWLDASPTPYGCGEYFGS